MYINIISKTGINEDFSVPLHRYMFYSIRPRPIFKVTSLVVCSDFLF